MTAPPPTNADDVLIAALDHAWQWFKLHSNQRMQFINHYLLAATFLVAAYTQALTLGNSLNIAAALIAFAGAILTLLSYKAERRVRRLIHDGEYALSELQKAVGQKLRDQISEDSICIADRADTAASSEWKYSSVFGWMYVLFGVGFINAALLAASGQQRLILSHIALSALVAGATLVAQSNFEQKNHPATTSKISALDGNKSIFGYLLIFFAIITAFSAWHYDTAIAKCVMELETR